jgi:hypothetical protein
MLSLIEVQRFDDDTIETHEILIGGQPSSGHGRFFAARITQIKGRKDFTITLPSFGQSPSVQALEDYAELINQVVRTAKQFQREIDNS